METDDATLLRRWRDGDKRSGQTLFERYYALVARFFSNKAMTDRADLVQATFTACIEKVDQLRDATSFRSFLFGIARFELLHYFRRKSGRETDLDAAEQSVCDLDPSPSRLIAEHQEQRLLLEALRRIPLDLQIVLELSYWERLTAVEIAEVLRIPEDIPFSETREFVARVLEAVPIYRRVYGDRLFVAAREGGGGGG